jgi:stress response protein YsnF
MTGIDPGNEQGIDPQAANAKSLTIPILEEQPVVSKREVVTDTILLRKTVDEQECLVEIPLIRREFTVERIPQDRVVEEVPPVRIDGDTTIYSVVEERIVKQMVVVEEIRVKLVEMQRTDSQVVTLLREQVFVEHSHDKLRDQAT